MASVEPETKTTTDVSVREYGRVQDLIDARLQTGQREFEAAELAAVADVDLPVVMTIMAHKRRKHAYITEPAIGRWRFHLNEEEEGQ